MNRFLRISGITASFLAIFLMVGGHWLVLQTIAWAQMIGDYSQLEPVASAIEKTFSGKYPCALCLQIRQGRQEQQNKTLPGISEKMPEMWCDMPHIAVPAAPELVRDVTPFSIALHADFLESPPAPPPRGA